MAIEICDGGNYDRVAELKAFDETKAGVKGLLDAGVTRVPRIFISTPPPEADLAVDLNHDRLEIPVIDLDMARREEVVEEIRRAATEWGFFQVVGHGVPAAVIEEMIAGVRRFNEMEEEVKKGFYSRDTKRKVRFNSNFDLYRSPAANWRDTLLCSMAPETPAADELPNTCREIVMEYSKHVSRLGETLFELLSEALGLKRTHLRDMECHKGHSLLCHYYPACPEPDLTFGTSPHSDSGFLTVLLQDNMGGLQVLHHNQWVDVPPLPGALVVNLADLLQLISNDKFVSVEHRVVAKKVGPRISVACFFVTHLDQPSTMLYGPIEELVSEESPPLYRQTLARDYISHFNAKGLVQGKSALWDFRL